MVAMPARVRLTEEWLEVVGDHRRSMASRRLTTRACANWTTLTCARVSECSIPAAADVVQPINPYGKSALVITQASRPASNNASRRSAFRGDIT